MYRLSSGGNRLMYWFIIVVIRLRKNMSKACLACFCFVDFSAIGTE